MSRMTAAVKKLDVRIGDVVEVEGRTYDVVADGQGGVSLESAITTTVGETLAEKGPTAMSEEEFDRRLGNVRPGISTTGEEPCARRATPD
jgi:hypothetical protein